MLTAFIILFSLCAFAIIVALDALLSIFPDFNLGVFRRTLKQKPNTNLLLYELPFLILVITVPIFVDESQNPLLLDMFPNLWVNIGFWGFIMILLAYFNIMRFQRFGMDRRRGQLLYSMFEESIETSENPSETIDQVLSTIRDSVKDGERVSETGFLLYLTKRDDNISEIAARKLDKLKEDA
jgi:hypothetical protein